jgi:hypothetical protein
MLDLALPLLTHVAELAVLCHVPGHYFTNAPPARRAWFRANADRLAFMSNLPVGPYGRRCAWLCVFASPAIKQQMFRETAGAEAGAATIPVIV